MGIRRAKERRIELRRQIDVVSELSTTGNQAGIFFAWNRLTDAKLHRVVLSHHNGMPKHTDRRYFNLDNVPLIHENGRLAGSSNTSWCPRDDDVTCFEFGKS